MATAALLLAITVTAAAVVMGSAAAVIVLWVTVGFALAGLHELTVRWTRR